MPAKKKRIKFGHCEHCGHPKGQHQAVRLHCPSGPKTRIGYIQFDMTKVFKEKTTP